MGKRKDADDSWERDELAIPLPIQIFLWRQSSPFIRPKLGKLHEATCLFCQSGPSHHEIKEASKSLEKVLVQNILFGLSPSLTDAIRSVPRWRFVQAAFPHVIHCAATVLYNRRDASMMSLGPTETKLLYTLHWILLDSVEECGDADSEKGFQKPSQFYYLFSVTTIQVFIYLFAPLLFALKESDFQNFRLENGLKIWAPLWEYRHPDVPCFTTAVRPKRTVLRGKRACRSKTQFGDVFLGSGNALSPDDDVFTLGGSGHSLQKQSSSSPLSDVGSYCPQDSRGLEALKLEEELRLIGGPREASFPETIPEETSSTEEEHVVIFRLGSYPDSDGLRDSQVYKAEIPSSFLRPPVVEVSDVSGQTSTQVPLQSASQPPSASISTPSDSQSARPGGTMSPFKSSSIGSGGRASPLPDPTLATILDVAVIRCLFIHQWTEEGVFWALTFVYRRMQEIGQETSLKEPPRRRSNSLPVPRIHVSFHSDTPEHKRDHDGSDHSSSEHYISESTFLTDGHQKERVRETGGSTRKKKRISDLRAFVETKLRSRSEKALEKIGRDDSRRSSISDDQGMDGSMWAVNRSHSPPDKGECSRQNLPHLSSLPSSQGLMKGKSMPSLSSLLDELPTLGYVGASQDGTTGKAETIDLDDSGGGDVHPVKRPIITVTQHTPSPSEHGWKDQLSQTGSIESHQYHYYQSPSHQHHIHRHPYSDLQKHSCTKPPLARSHTDSNIQYPCPETSEIPGASNFVTREGHINLRVLLKAAQAISQRDSHVCSMRVCEIILHLLDFLLDMGILKMSIKLSKIDKNKQEAKIDGYDQTEDSMDTEVKDYNPVGAYMMTTMRIISHLGCPHGCGEGMRGPPADFLRHSGQSLLSRIYRSDQNSFRKYLKMYVSTSPLQEILDFMHSFLGFCVDPSSLLSPMNTKRPGTGRNLDTQQGGYTTNFGSSLGGAGSRGIEGQVVACTLKGLVSRFVRVHSNLKSSENMVMYSDIRQFMCYVKETHGGVFRRVTLSGLIDSADRPHKKVHTTQTTRVVRRVTVPADGTRDSPSTLHEEGAEATKSKKGIFKKKVTSSSITSAMKKASSMSSICDDQPEDSSHGQSPASTLRRRPHTKQVRGLSESDHGISRKKNFKKLVNWIRKTRVSDEPEFGIGSALFGSRPEPELPSTIARKYSQPLYPSARPRYVTKPGAGPMTQRLNIAKKKVEDRLKGKLNFGKNKKRDTSSDETPDPSRRNSEDLQGSLRETSVLLLRERKLVDCDTVKTGMLRFSFVLETCQPGSVPDAQLAGSIIDLPGAPVVARAAMLLEMAHFVNKCNRGAWPVWMKSLPFYRPPGNMTRTAATGPRRVPAIQRAAGKMFYGWAEAIAVRLEELFEEIGPTKEDVNQSVQDSEVKKAYRTRDEEEDFLDELNVNTGGGDCPLALRIIAVQLLLEITSFLREAYPMLPKAGGRMSVRERPPGWPMPGTLGVAGRDHQRRLSTTLSLIGPPFTSIQSLHSVGEGPTTERKISFAAVQEADNESVSSSNTTLTGSRSHFLKKSGGSFKRRSYKLKRGNKDPDNDSIKRSDSIRSRRKVSAVSERSDTSDHLEPDVSGEESPGVLSNEDLADSPVDPELDEENITSSFPWLRVVVKVCLSFNMNCTHQGFCHPCCYRRHMRACKRLIHAVRKVYGDEFEEVDEFGDPMKDAARSRKKDKKQTRKTSEPAHGSPVKRKDSFVKKEKLEKTVDLSAVLSRLGHPHQGSTIHLSKDTIDTAGANEDEKEKEGKESDKDKKKGDLPVILKYIKTQIMGLFSSPFSLIIKSITVISEDLIVQVLPVAWDMLLEHDNELTATAAVIFILSGVRAPVLANNIINSQLTNSDPSIRLNAILRFQVIWQSRHQAWPRMEEGAHMTFKVPPHGIEFTLPSPKVGVESIPVVDPPWMPQVKPNVEEVTIDQIQHRSFLTANRTRRKIHAEMVKTALEAEETKRRTERENFLLSSVPVTIQAAYEPSLHHVVADDHEEGEDNEVEPSGRQISAHHVCVAQQLFPSCLCSSVLTIIHLLDDPAVTPDGVAVYQAAEQVIWSCLVEDSALFLRFFLEKLTREKHDVMVRLLRRLVRFIPWLPSQAAFALFNYLVGYVMFYTRSPHEGAQDHTAAALSVLWMVVPSVHAILFKDLKQIFRKEQCDAALLLTANIPSAKKIIVHGPGGLDAGGIPSQFPIQEDTQFSQIHVESIDFFGIPEEDAKYYFLVDHKTNQIHNMNSYVRDFYFFKRSQYPQLILIKLEPDEAFNALQRQTFIQKFLEIGKVLLAWSVLKRPDQVSQRVFFLHEELTKLPSFPRKALEADFSLYKGGAMDKELRGLDQLHKYMWVNLIARMFEGMASNLNYTTDLRLFVSVINGALVLHCEDSSMLRVCMATFINAATQFKNLFSTNGYMLIMPTILRVYSNYQSNKMVCKTIEMVVKQMYILHRKPFILQMLGSVAPLLDTDDAAVYGDANKIRGSRLFNLLHSLDKHHEDYLHILELTCCEKPLRALDFCYSDESDNLSFLEVIDMCVTVVAYAADSRRGHQMLAILEAILPKTLQHLHKPSKRDMRQERETIHHVAIAVKTLVINSEPLSKNYNGPQLSGMGGGEGWGSNRAPYTKASRTHNPPIDPDDDSHSKYVSDPKRQPMNYQTEIEDPELLRQQFRQPRAMLLNIVAEFLTTCTARLIEIQKKTGQDAKQADLLDTKCHLRLAEVAHSLLKMAPYDPMTMGCQGLQRYMNDILPHPDWSHEDLRPALVNILRRLEKMFNKLFKKSAVRRITDWVAASSLLKGVYTTLCKYPYIAHLPHLKMLVHVCQTLVLGERMSETESAYPSVISTWSNTPPQEFCSMVVRIIAMQILALGATYSLEQICGGPPLTPNSEKTENLLVNLLLPMCLRVGCSKDSPRMRHADISFAVTVVLHAMNPPLAKAAATNPNPPAKSGQPAKSSQPVRSGQGSDPRSQSWSHHHLDPKYMPKVRPGLLKISFLGLKVIIVCFEKQLSQDWHRIVHCLRDMDSRGEGGVAMLDFLDFVVLFRNPLYLLLKPFMLKKVRKIGNTGGEASQLFKSSLSDRMKGINMPPPVCKGVLIRTLAHYLKTLREEMATAKISGESELRPSSLEIQSEGSHLLRRQKTSGTAEGKVLPSPQKLRESTSGATASSTSEPRLYRKTFLLRKRGSSASLLQGTKGESGSGISTPTSPADASATAGDTTGDDGSLGNRYRFQRQLAQSRKTFRFRRSRHGQPSEAQSTATSPQTEVITSQQTSQTTETTSQVPSVTTPASAEDSKQVNVPIIPEKEQPANSSLSSASVTRSPTQKSPPHTSTPYIVTTPVTLTALPPSSIEPEGVSEIRGMETSNISGYRDRFVGIDTRQKDLEQLEMQIRSGHYQAPLAHYEQKAPLGEDKLETSLAETISHQSSVAGSSHPSRQQSRQSSITSKRHSVVSQDPSQIRIVTPPERKSLVSPLFAQDQPQGYSRHPSIQIQEGQEVASTSCFRGLAQGRKVSSTSQANKPSPQNIQQQYQQEKQQQQHQQQGQHQQQQQQQQHYFHKKGPTFRHSWAEGEVPYSERYHADQSTIPPRSKVPTRKRGVVATTSGVGDIRSTRYVSTSEYTRALAGIIKRTPEESSSSNTKRSDYSTDTSTRGYTSTSGSSTPQTSDDMPAQIIVAGAGLPAGTKRFVVDKFTVTFTEKDDDNDTLI